MKYLKVYTDFDKSIELLSDAERGRLFTAMLEYAKQGTEPDLRGNERFVWPTAKQNIDRQESSYNNKVVGAEKAREAKASSDIKGNQNDNSDIRKKELISTQDKEKDKDKDKDKTSSLTDDRFEQFWQAYPRKIGKGSARQAWAKTKMTDELFDTILNAVEQQKQWEQWQRDNGQYIPHPATWLNQQRWEDLGIIVPKKKSKYANVKIN